MTAPHPKLCFRPTPKKTRPKLTHPDLGELEFINHPPGWWQGTVLIAGSPARLDLQCGGKISEEEIAAGAETIRWIQEIELRLREHIAKQISANDFNSNIDGHAKTR